LKLQYHFWYTLTVVWKHLIITVAAMASVSTGCLTHSERDGSIGSLFVYNNVYGWNFNWKRVTGYGVFTLAKC
jgi:hypothetical protein